MMKKIDKLEKTFWEIVKTLCVFILFFGSGYIQLFFFYLFRLKKDTLTPFMGVVLSVLSNVVLCFIFYFMYRKELNKEFKIFKKKPLEKLDIGIKWWMIGIFVMVVSSLFIHSLFHGTGANNEKAVQAMIAASPFLMILDAGILAPFSEEIVFRKSLGNILSNKWIFALVSFLIFGGAHVLQTATSFVDYLYIVPYGALGFAFAMTYKETDTIFTTVVIHMIHNTFLILFSIL